MRFETCVLLEESLLWTWQRHFYQRQAAAAWTGAVVPWRITSTPVMADALAQVIAAFAADTRAAGLRREGQPVCVADLGAGVGRLAFLLCRRLLELKVPFRYLMTDLAAANVAAWQAHPQLRALAEAGVLDFAVADAARPEALGLVARGEVWAPGELPGPLVAIASYLFDTLPHSLWRNRRGRLEQGRVTLSAPGDVLGPTPPPIEQVRWDFSFAPPAGPVPTFVRGYSRAAPEGPFLVPVGALACLGALAQLGGGRFLCVALDKGPRTAAQLQALPFPPLARHGCASASVNFHALRAWAGYRPWLEAAAPDAAFGVYGLAQGLLPDGLAQTRAAFARALGGGPALGLEAELQALEARGAAASGVELVECLVKSRGAPDAVLRLAAELRRTADGLPPEALAALVEVLDRAADADFALPGAPDLDFEIATVLHRAGQLSHAGRCYRASLAKRGDHPTTRFNLALCHLDTGARDQARGELEQVLALVPGHARARALLDGL